jgi:hypothetical protein
MPLSISKETIATAQSHFGWVSVGTVPVQLTTNRNLLAKKGVLIRSIDHDLLPGSSEDALNGVIYVGSSELVRAIISPATEDDMQYGGMPLKSGDTIIVPFTEPYRIWLVSDQADQLVAWILV